MGELSGRHLVVGLTGGIAAYKTCELVRRCRDEGATVQVVMSRGALQFVTATTLQALSGRPVYTDPWDPRIGNGMPHIELSRSADAIVVAPASAHFMARLAQGLADDLLTTLVLARQRQACPLLLAPAMNVEMWEHPATRRNLATVIADGALVIGPAAGDQACGETGSGRMLEPAEILEDLIAALQPQSLRGHRVLVTAGPTFEPIDPVRAITNRSSGKMGYAVARAAREAGAEVTLVSGPTGLPVPRGLSVVNVETAQQMLDAVLARVDGIDVFVGVAAVADWRIATPSDSKLKKGERDTPPPLHLALNPDILGTVAARPQPPFCVGFAAETDRILEHGQAKLRAKRVALMVANRAQDAFGADDNELHLIDAEGVQTLPRAGKLALARRLVAEIAVRLGRAGRRQ